MSRVRIIPPTVDPLTQLPINSNKKLKVAAYARVSTQTEEQATSYEAQIKYYEAYIKDNPEWEYVKVYADEGITGTSTRRRTGFNEMIKDAIDGKVDLIITKSISRFARNTLDTISFVRKLKEHGVEVYFENENIWTLDSQGELLLTLMASIAQEESRNISERVKWGKRAAFKEGRVSFAYSRFLGYEKIEDEIVIVENEAKTVERIYKMFLVDGETPTGIAKTLREEEVKTPSGRSTNWQTNNVISILTNEKYKGDALLQKTYVDNFLTQNIIKNTGQKPQYYVENSHPAIIDKDMWELVQVELERRKKMGPKYSATDIFASKLICEDCGSFYGRKKWHSNTKYERYVYQCNKKFHKGNDKCKTPHLTEVEIKEKFIKAYNITMEDKEIIKEDLKSIIKLLTDTNDIDKKINETNEELTIVVELAKQAIEDNSKTDLSDDEFNERYNGLLKRHEGLQKKLDELLEVKQEKESKAIRMNAFLNTLHKAEDELSEWNKHIWMLMVEEAIVHRDSNITFKFYNGLTVK